MPLASDDCDDNASILSLDTVRELGELDQRLCWTPHQTLMHANLIMLIVTRHLERHVNVVDEYLPAIAFDRIWAAKKTIDKLRKAANEEITGKFLVFLSPSAYTLAWKCYWQAQKYRHAVLTASEEAHDLKSKYKRRFTEVAGLWEPGDPVPREVPMDGTTQDRTDIYLSYPYDATLERHPQVLHKMLTAFRNAEYTAVEEAAAMDEGHGYDALCETRPPTDEPVNSETRTRQESTSATGLLERLVKTAPSLTSEADDHSQGIWPERIAEGAVHHSIHEDGIASTHYVHRDDDDDDVLRQELDRCQANYDRILQQNPVVPPAILHRESPFVKMYLV